MFFIDLRLKYNTQKVLKNNKKDIPKRTCPKILDKYF